MTKEKLQLPHEILNLNLIESSLVEVQDHWPEIDDELDRLGIGRKDIPFDPVLRERMVIAYSYLNQLIINGIKPFSRESLSHMLELNNLVLYGADQQLRDEYKKALKVTEKKFNQQIGVVRDWYHKHDKRGDSPTKLAAEVYVGILGAPQVFIEGNHRAGCLIASWINLASNLPPFVLSLDNAIAYFAPSAEIKNFTDKTTWRGRRKLPKYRKSFKIFWEQHTNNKYLTNQSS